MKEAARGLLLAGLGVLLMGYVLSQLDVRPAKDEPLPRWEPATVTYPDCRQVSTSCVYVADEGGERQGWQLVNVEGGIKTSVASVEWVSTERRDGVDWHTVIVK